MIVPIYFNLKTKLLVNTKVLSREKLSETDRPYIQQGLKYLSKKKKITYDPNRSVIKSVAELIQCYITI